MPKTKSKNYEFVRTVIEKDSFKDVRCEVFEADGAHGFRFAFGDKPGIVGLEFYAHGLFDWAHNQSELILAKLALGLRQTLGDEKANKAVMKWPDDDDRRIIAETVALVFLKGMSGKISTLLKELELETECYVYEVARKTMPVIAKSEYDSVERLAKEIATERKQFLKGSIARFGEPRWHEMKGKYETLLNDISAAKAIQEKYKKKNWRGMIEAGFPELDQDIITLLSEDDDELKTLPAAIYKATENGEYRKGSDLALEQAARKCGMNPFRFVPRTLRGKMGQAGEEN